jgi:hypothetical protein
MDAGERKEEGERLFWLHSSVSPIAHRPIPAQVMRTVVLLLLQFDS